MTPEAPIALSLGDPAGIGPEIIAEAWVQRDRTAPTGGDPPPFFVVGGPEVLRAAIEARGLDCPVVPIADPAEALFAFSAGLPVMAGLDAPYAPGAPSEAGAKLALASLSYATRFTMGGVAAALVTGPIAKSELARIGFDAPGQTEFLADACRLPYRDAVMMLAGPSLRTVPLTVHCALAEVPAMLTSDLIVHKARIVAGALARDFGVERARLAVAGLNPHAGENGKFGDEEARIIEPAIRTLQSEGFDVFGPVPGDALFTSRVRETYDAALCMYHDQALIPLKALEFDEGVNVTLGLPIIRTSPDHGTAFDIAGKGLADPGAMCAAIRMAGECAALRAAA
ncbi:4-hydroxythreonine-4-phosphate dehydrogenase [Erythrobacter litoralis]|uniref:4-hydroxythreonine-4-phosphate dehydrogenase n=1 Tax=Erythrobacter litoralis TaxID=39960 RepID=A0A074MMT2_9SPHN|nr:4-hydroxythreonine-4-phosphate dehydrogenase PdxA [Erythrobacter litoralis]AOL23016.1 4-hydroxythreonine-4-phosphate dehydrogenase [Erythrobacter litoralis]KEO93118.1 4-hydroxythreonine-4-phosphate dehydrogenase [Erythrobacter litoralis]MEE4338443.1 4-hydroxythreonine-4-phosphate dehydrogenase PdxA [Erythrobacter sp.]